MDYQVVLSSSSRKDLQDIVRFISFDDPSRALHFGRFLIHHTKGLAQFPERGRVVPELGDDTIWEIIVRNYRVIYRVNHDKGSIQVIRFWYPEELRQS
jgi:plasmid stabilization system protein ParE